jgi:hypothetical protein
LVAQIRSRTVDDASFPPTIEQLRECVEHHVQEEEQEILPAAEAQLHEELLPLAKQMQQRKQELMGHAATSHQPGENRKQEASPEPLPTEQGENGHEALSELPSQSEYSSETSH